MADETMTPEEERGVLAGEYALGLLEGEEASAARRMVLADRGFAEQVRWWNHRLAAMAERAASVEVDETVWPGIERRIGSGGGIVEEIVDPTDKASSGLSGFGLWAALGGTAAAAAAITLFFVTPQATQGPLPVPAETQAPQERLIAQLQSEDGSIQLAGLVDPAGDNLRLNISGLQPGEGSAAELWVVPSDGVPRSLGAIPDSGSFSRELTGEELGLLVPGSALAVTYEDGATIPHPAPTTEILVVGALSQV